MRTPGRALVVFGALLALTACDGTLESNPIEPSAAGNNATPANNTTPGNNTTPANTTPNNTTPGNNTTPSNDPEPTCENYCDTVMTNCTGDQAQYGSEAECLDYCSNVGQWEAGTKGARDGDTIACRIYHGNDPASADPATHCDHAGPSGGNVCGSWCDVYCTLSLAHCEGEEQLYADADACATACGGFDDTGAADASEGNTVQCRIYHLGAPAAADPATHCPHGAEMSSLHCNDAAMEFVFRKNPVAAYTRVDRIGMPAVSTALINPENKDAYNDGAVADDAEFAGDIVAFISVLHDNLDDDLAGLSLTPCTAGADGSCVATGGPLIIPDTIKIDPAGDAGFPNGRKLADPVMDVTLAVLLLELADGTHSPTDLVGVNPTQNDSGIEGTFLTQFPYLHAPHEP